MITVGQFIYEDVICMFGIPKILQHDQGTEFCNRIIQFICEKIGIKEAISSAYHPQTNGLTERSEFFFIDFYFYFKKPNLQI